MWKCKRCGEQHPDGDYLCPSRGDEPASSGNSDVVSRRQHPGYRARNLDVATAYGLNAELCKTLDRMRKRGDCPLWLIESLCDCIQRSNVLIGALRRYRDDLPEFLDGHP